uniref:Uncharacterized protein n=1 Tax=Anguilla anguilla TaxID=7936 RepID=A0A0E9PNR3_ANGAN
MLSFEFFGICRPVQSFAQVMAMIRKSREKVAFMIAPGEDIHN